MVINSTQPALPTWKVCSTDIEQLVAANEWQALVQAGTFEPTKAILSLEATKQEFLKLPTHRTIEEVFSNPTATLSTVNKYRGRARVQAIIEHLIKASAKFLNVGRGMNEYQIAETARMIYDDYYFFTVADLKVCFRSGVSGKFGQVYDRLDGMVIFDWLEKYAGERSQIAERESVKHMKANAEKEKEKHMPQWLSQWLKDWEAKRKKVFTETKPSDANGVRFWNLQAFLEHIAKDTADDKNEIWQLFEAKYMNETTEIEFEAYAVYQSNLILLAINKGEINNWEQLINSI